MDKQDFGLSNKSKLQIVEMLQRRKKYGKGYMGRQELQQFICWEMFNKSYKNGFLSVNAEGKAKVNEFIQYLINMEIIRENKSGKSYSITEKGMSIKTPVTDK